ncbi:5-methylcytosine-specific restriction enzyme subunit McrC [Filimonas zeae]|uniref:5-methylcytosine-specific restriction enzyme subunit McrC n=1 Tax=Filimonas zeae TaxID=1737353 RepID=A0A917MT91_9BACT|nr:restriction endonuclease [Filimonas zeae]MDR6337577.1 5-methylcytosine-specific restriction enzyme subunit McrC [Filimonas zeae]GGH59289.1 hypothetical protein GCM10011379_05900 [Filimonas zeae]
MKLFSNKNIIRVFEHQKLFFGEGGCFAEKHWKALSRYNEKYKNRYFTVLHNGIKFSNYVGVIQAGNLTIEILPKIDKANLDSDTEKKKWHNILLQLLQECNLLKIENAEKANLKLKVKSILDIYVELFLNEVEILLHRGLIKKYKCNAENITTLKGRINFPKHFSVNMLHKEKFYVQHLIYDRQNVYNQVIKEALLIIPSLISNPFLINRLGKILLEFPELSRLAISADSFRKIKYDRKSVCYKEAIEIAKMLLLNYRPDITGGTNDVIAILFDMNELWEEYIFRKLQKAANGNVKVRRQQMQRFWKMNDSTYSKTIRPDIVIDKGDETIVLDTKWKLISDFTPTDDDLKQMFVYNLFWKCKHGVLLYPAIEYQRRSGTYFRFQQQMFEETNCLVATCNVLNEKSMLDKAIGVKILNDIVFSL